MATPEVEFTHVTELRAEALGKPGQRTFRILVDSANSSATMWLEKDQLFQLALAITQLLTTLPERSEPENSDPDRGSDPTVQLDFDVGKMTLAQDEVSRRLIIDAHDVESGEDGDPTVRVWGDLTQFKKFSEEAIRVCAAGRPTCPLCGVPLDPSGHKCPRANGHGVVDLREL